MKKIKLKVIITSIAAALSFGGSLVVSTQVQARTVYCSNCATSSQGDTISGHVGNTASNTRRANTLLQDLIDKLEKTRTDIVDAIGQSTTGVGTAVSQSGEIMANDRAESDQFREIIAATKSRPKAAEINCGNVGSGSAPSSTTQKGGGGGGGSGGGSFSGGSNANLKKVQTNVGLTKSVPKIIEIPTNDVQAGLTGISLCQSYGSGDSVRGQVCKDVGVETGGGEYADADISGETLLIGPQKKSDGKKVKRNSFASDSEEHQAMMASMTVLFAPDAPPILPKNQAKTAAGRQYLGKLTKWFANQDLSKQIAQNRVDSFLADKGTLPALNEILQDGEDAGFLGQYLADIDGWQSKGVSTALMRDIEVDRRASNPLWTIRVPSLDEAARQTEALYMQAQQLKISRDILDEISTSNILLAKLLDTNNENIFKEVERSRFRAINELANEIEYSSGSTEGGQP